MNEHSKTPITDILNSVPCRCGSRKTAVLWKGGHGDTNSHAVVCYDCGNEGPRKPTMREAAYAWRDQ